MAALASVGWGATDYFGGVARKATSVFVIIAITELGGGVLVAPALLASNLAQLEDPRLLYACAAGVGVSVELGIVFMALSRGDAFITAPIGGLGAAIAVTFGLLRGDRLDGWIGLGLTCAIAGGALSVFDGSRPNREHRGSRTGVLMCVGAAGGVAGALIAFNLAGRIDPVGATVFEHVSCGASALVIELLAGAGTVAARLPDRSQLLPLVLVVVTGLAGDLAYTFASQHSDVSVVSAVASLYPITTMALAVGIQRRRATAVQAAAVALAMVGAVTLGLTAG